MLPPVDDCAGAVAIVVGSDAAAQSDVYSAVTLAGVVDAADAERGACVVLAGGRSEPMPAEQQARLAEASGAGWVVGGPAAVPDEKVPASFPRLWGPDRWATARAVGAQATRLRTGDSGAPTPAPSSGTGRPAGPGGAALPPVDDCAGAVAIVVGSDAAAQSDVYSAVTLAGVVDAADAERGACVVLAGGRSEPMPAEQRARLAEAAAGGFVVGGIAAVPTAKIAGRDMTRLAGADRWATARLVGRRASGDTTAGTSTADESQDASDGAPASEAAFTQISMSTTGNYVHGCALRADQTAVCWGDNSFGQASVPTGRFQVVATAESLSCGIRVDDTVACWGYRQEQWAKALKSESLSAFSIAGTTVMCGVRSDGDIACWIASTDYDSGESSVDLVSSLTGPFVTVVRDAEDAYSWCGIRTDDTVACVHFSYHFDGDGQLVLSHIEDMLTSEAIQSRGGFASVVLGEATACVLGDDGGVSCVTTLGDQWGNPLKSHSFPPESQPSGTFRSVVAAKTGIFRDLYCGIRSNFTVMCWEYLMLARDSDGNPTNDYGQESTVTWSMARYDDIATGRFKSISLSGELGCGIRVDDTMACWWNLAGFPPNRYEHSRWAVYDYSMPHEQKAGPSSVKILGGVPSGEFTSVSVDGEVACGIRVDGAIICMSLRQNSNSAILQYAPATSGVVSRSWLSFGNACVLRQNHLVECPQPLYVAQPSTGQFKSVSWGRHGGFACGILMHGGKISCWGPEEGVQLSDGFLPDGALEPPLGSFSALSVNGRYACAIRSDATLACWGGFSGSDRAFEVVSADSIPRGTFRTIAAGVGSACAVRTDDTVACWGNVLYGGHPKTGSSEQLATPPSGRFRSVAAGNGYWCGIRLDGTVACWGGNYAGDAQPPPSGTFEIVQVDGALACGLRTDKTIACWGQWGFDSNFGRVFSDFKTWLHWGEPTDDAAKAARAQIIRRHADFLQKSHQNVRQVDVINGYQFCFGYTDGSYVCHWPSEVVLHPGTDRNWDGFRVQLFS